MIRRACFISAKCGGRRLEIADYKKKCSISELQYLRSGKGHNYSEYRLNIVQNKYKYINNSLHLARKYLTIIHRSGGEQCVIVLG